MPPFVRLPDFFLLLVPVVEDVSEITDPPMRSFRGNMHLSGLGGLCPPMLGRGRSRAVSIRASWCLPIDLGLLQKLSPLGCGGFDTSPLLLIRRAQGWTGASWLSQTFLVPLWYATRMF